MDYIWNILQELANYGFGLWGLILFAQTRRLKKAELARDTVNVYRQIAESNNDTLQKLSERNQKQDEKILGMEETIDYFLSVFRRMEACRHYAACPARPVMQDGKRKYFHAPVRPPGMGQKGQRYPRDHPDEPRHADGAPRQPP